MLVNVERTRDIVNRLVMLGNRLQAAVVINSAVAMAALLGILGALVAEDAWGWFAIIGLLLGLLGGLFVAAFMVLVLEWMAQTLLAVTQSSERGS